jgi:hypothetical protein
MKVNPAFVFKRIHAWFAGVIRKPRTALALTIVVLLAITFQALSFTELGIASEVGLNMLPESSFDLSAVPQSVVDNAVEMATSLFQGNQEKRKAFVEQLLAMYCEAEDKDVVVLFNPGGWGWNVADSSTGWQTILTGIGTELSESGYKPLLLNYQRSVNSLRGHTKELIEMFTGYSAKAGDLSSRIEFLTENLSGIKIILAGESNGSIICDRVMAMQKDNERVLSIQTGPPFWHRSLNIDRELVLNDNGVIPDSFSRGDFITLARANLLTCFGMFNSDSESGTILLHLQAPGHRYSWLYPEVRSKIENFLRSY